MEGKGDRYGNEPLLFSIVIIYIHMYVINADVWAISTSTPSMCAFLATQGGEIA